MTNITATIDTANKNEVIIPAEPTAPVAEGTGFHITRRAYVIFENSKWLVVVDDVELSTYNDFNEAVHTATAFTGSSREW